MGRVRGCLMWPGPSRQTALWWDTPDLIPMQTFWINGEEAAVCGP